MVLRWKVDVLAALKEAGFSSYRIRQEKLFGQSTLTCIRQGQTVAITVIDKICCMTGKQPGDLIEYVPDQKEDK